MTVIAVPQMSIAMEEAVVVRWLVADGATVGSGQPVAEIETDKATVEVESPAAGTIAILAAAGAVVPVGGALAQVGAASETAASLASEPVAALALPSASPFDLGVRQVASPAARRVAAERGVDLWAVTGSGPGGRIVVRDIPSPLAGGAGQEPGARRRAVVRNIVASWQQIPHTHIGGELDGSGLVAAREAAKAGGIAATVTDLLLVALVRALRTVPELSAVVGSEGPTTVSPPVVAVAVATPEGVVAPGRRRHRGHDAR